MNQVSGVGCRVSGLGEKISDTGHLAPDTPLTGLRRAPATPAYGAAAWLRHRAFLMPRREALVDRDRHVTYAQLAERAARLAAALQDRHGIQRHDRVATLAANCAEWLELFYATARIGAILVPLNWRLAPPELDFQLRDSAARLLFVGPEHVALADRLARDLPLEARVEVGPGYEALLAGAAGRDLPEAAQAGFADPHLILYTSGTTGWPKGAVLTHANTFWNCVNAGAAFGLSDRDTTLTALPLFHAGGVGLLTLPSLHLGGRVVLMRTFDAARACVLIREHAVSVFFGVPAIWLAMLERPDFTAASYPSLRALGSGGAPCPLAVIEQLAARGFTFLQGYGLTETAPGGTLIPPDDWRRKAGSVGKAMPHVELRVVDEADVPVAPGVVGEVHFRGPNLFAGYWNRPEATAEAFTAGGWFRSGDLGRVDDEGFLTLVDRKKDLIISGGENVYSAEVEDALFAHPAVAEAAVIGVPDQRWGEAVRAVVVLRPDHAATAEELVEHCRARLARYKAPRSVVFVDALPRNAAGKVLKPELRRAYGLER